MTRVAALTMILSSPAIGAGEPGLVRIATFSVTQADITELAQKLAEATMVRICVEKPVRPARGVPATGGAVESDAKPEVTFSFAVTDTTLREVLAEVVRMAPAYTWSFDESTSTINVYPCVGAALDCEVPDVVIEAMTAREALASPGPLRLFSRHKIGISTGMGNLSWLDAPVSLRTHGLNARQALNRLVAQLHWEQAHCHRWELVPLPPGFRVRAMVRLRWYGGDKTKLHRAGPPEAQSGSDDDDAEPRPRARTSQETGKPAVPAGGPERTAEATGVLAAGGRTPIMLCLASAAGLCAAAAAAWLLLRRRSGG